MSDYDFLKSILLNLPDVFFNLSIILLAIYFLLKKRKVEIWLILIGKLFHLTGVGFNILFQFKISKNMGLESLWITYVQAGLNLIGTVVFTIGLLILMWKYLKILQINNP